MKMQVGIGPLFWVDLEPTRKGVKVTVWQRGVLHRVVYPTTLRTVQSALAYVRGVLPGFKWAERQGLVQQYKVPQAA